jgi:hypothetical protein
MKQSLVWLTKVGGPTAKSPLTGAIYKSGGMIFAAAALIWLSGSQLSCRAEGVHSAGHDTETASSKSGLTGKSYLIPTPLGSKSTGTTLSPCELPQVVTPYQASSISYLYTGDFGDLNTVPQERTLQSRLDDWLSIVDFGARGDTECDSAPAINAAIAAAKGRTIFWPAGVYRIGSEIVVAPGSSLSFAGSGAASTFLVAEHAENAILNLTLAANIDIRAMGFVGIGAQCGLAIGSPTFGIGAANDLAASGPVNQLPARTTLRDFAIHGQFADAHLCQGPGGDHNITNMRLSDMPGSSANTVVGYRYLGDSQVKSSTLMLNPVIKLHSTAPSSRAMVLQRAANLTVLHPQIETHGASAQIAFRDALQNASFVGGRIRYQGATPKTFYLETAGYYKNLTLRALAVARVAGVHGAKLSSLSMTNTYRSQPASQGLIVLDSLHDSRVDYARYGVKVHTTASGNEFFDAGDGSTIELPASAFANRYYLSSQIDGQKVASIRVDGLASRVKKIGGTDFEPEGAALRYQLDDQTDVLLIDGATLTSNPTQYLIKLPNKGREGQSIVVKVIDYQQEAILKIADTPLVDLDGSPVGQPGCKLKGYQYIRVTAGPPRAGTTSKGCPTQVSSWWVTGGICEQQ